MESIKRFFRALVMIPGFFAALLWDQKRREQEKEDSE